MKTLQQQISEKLKNAFEPEVLEIVNQSSLHTHHKGNSNPSQETHFLIRLTSKVFAGKSLLEQHKMVYTILHEELTRTTLHALSLELSIPPQN